MIAGKTVSELLRLNGHRCSQLFRAVIRRQRSVLVSFRFLLPMSEARAIQNSNTGSVRTQNDDRKCSRKKKHRKVVSVEAPPPKRSQDSSRTGSVRAHNANTTHNKKCGLTGNKKDLLVFGRKTYQLMVPFWPEVAKSQSDTKASNEFARTFDSLQKIVFSRSLGSAEDKKTRIIRTNLHDEILKLKQEPGKNILVGGVSLPSQVIELGLVDQYRFVVGPILAGEGRRLMEGVSLPEKLQLKLVESKPFKSGCVALRYLKQ